jgi:RHS repeat-associated protein
MTTTLGTTNYLYDGLNTLEATDQNGNALSSYVDTRNIDEPLAEMVSGARSYYEQDGLGSITSLSNSSGAPANTYTYDSYGNLTASTGTLTNPFRYTGREYDSETGLLYYRARYYDPNGGRLISVDPIGFEGGINFYPYALNSPVNFRDPMGQSAGAIAIPAAEWVGGAICFGSGACETAIVVGGVVIAVAETGYLIYNYANNSDASAGSQSKAKPSACKANGPKDPCKGLRDILAEHQRKLNEYATNPYAQDNKNILGKGYDDTIIAGRVKGLVHDIIEYQKQLEECERRNGMR